MSRELAILVQDSSRGSRRKIERALSNDCRAYLGLLRRPRPRMHWLAAAGLIGPLPLRVSGIAMVACIVHG